MSRLIEPRVLRGFRDYPPALMIPRERLMETARKVYRSYGFAPIDTPAIELTEVLLAKVEPGAEINKQLYRFKDAGDRDVALRFDLTVPLARFAAQHYTELGLPFKRYHLGPLVGTRTWGGLVGIYDYPQLMDGGSVTAPRVAFYNRKGEWDVENHGVAPDVEVELTPKDWMTGHDPQLEKAVALVMDSLKKNPLPVAKRPAFPNYHNTAPAEGVPAAGTNAGASGERK